MEYRYGGIVGRTAYTREGEVLDALPDIENLTRSLVPEDRRHGLR